MAPRLDAVMVAGLTSRANDPRTDAELLHCFIQQHDEGAFEAILVRHAGSVRAVCRSWLRSEADVDDAMQATFFVLVRRAEAIRQRQALGGWLCRVAENVAKRLRQQLNNRVPMVEEPPIVVALPDDSADVVAEEVTRLPEQYRRVVQMCYFAGMSTADAAGQLGWPKGTVLTRLAWAKKRLHARLLARGVAPAILVTVASMSAPALNPRWVWATVKGGLSLRAGNKPADLGLRREPST